MFIINWIARFLIIINSNQHPGEVAGGVAFGFMLGMIPPNNLMWFALLIIIFLLRVNLGAVLIFAVIFRLTSPLFDALLDQIGQMILTIPSLYDIFTYLYNLPIIPYSNFNHTIVTGGFVFGIIMWLPIFFIFVLLVRIYRKSVRDRLVKTKFVQGFTKFPIIKGILDAYDKAQRVYTVLH